MDYAKDSQSDLTFLAPSSSTEGFPVASIHSPNGQTTRTKRAILYARVSDDDRRYMTSGIDNQLADGRKYAAERGYQVVGEFHEERERKTSGADWLPEIEKILELAEQGAFDVLIVRELDRLARDRVKHVLVRHHLANCGVAVEYIIGQFADSDEGEFQEGVMREFAHYQRKQLIRKLHRGIRDNVRRHGAIKTGGCGAPYGYDLVKVDDRWTLVINEYEAGIVRLIFDLYVIQGYGILALCMYLDDHRIPKPMKGKAHKANVDKDRDLGWSAGTIGALLRNEVYVGRWYYRKTRPVKNPKTQKVKHAPRPKSDWILVSVPAIISEELYQAVLERRERNRQQEGKQHRRVYPIGGMLTCGRCGNAMTGATQNIDKVHKRPYSYYCCCARRHKRRYGRSCELPYVPAGKIEATIWQWVKNILLDPKRLKAELDNYQQAQQAGLKPFLDLLESNEKQLGRLKEEKERLIKAYAAGVLTLDEIAVQKSELDSQISDLSQAIAQLRADIEPKALSKQTIEAIERYAAEVRLGADLADVKPETQREIYKILNMHIVLDEAEGIPVADVECILGHPRLSPNNGTRRNFGRSAS